MYNAGELTTELVFTVYSHGLLMEPCIIASCCYIGFHGLLKHDRGIALPAGVGSLLPASRALCQLNRKYNANIEDECLRL